MIEPVEEFLEIDVDHNLIAFLHIALCFSHCIMRALARPKPEAEL